MLMYPLKTREKRGGKRENGVKGNAGWEGARQKGSDPVDSSGFRTRKLDPASQKKPPNQNKATERERQVVPNRCDREFSLNNQPATKGGMEPSGCRKASHIAARSTTTLSIPWSNSWVPTESQEGGVAQVKTLYQKKNIGVN